MTTNTHTVEVHQCSNCGGEVAARRKSYSGTHWCSKPDCVAAKQRYYRRNRGAEAKAKLAARQNQADRLDIVTYVIRGRPRQLCDDCGREDAVPGFAHPTPDWTARCERLGLRGANMGIDWVSVIWPEGAPI